MNTGKRNESPIGHKSKPHELPLVGFLVYIILDGKTRPSGTLPLFLAIEPFAYVVGNYTSQNREDKRLHLTRMGEPFRIRYAPSSWRRSARRWKSSQGLSHRYFRRRNRPRKGFALYKQKIMLPCKQAYGSIYFSLVVANARQLTSSVLAEVSL